MQGALRHSSRWIRLIRNAIIALVVLFALFVLAAYFAAPAFVKSTAEKQIEMQTGRKASLGAVHIDPWRLSATVTDFKLYEADGKTLAAQVDEIYADISSASLFRCAAVFDELRVVKPVLHLARLAPSRFSFSDIIEKILAKPKSDDTVHFSINNIRIEGGEIDFDDKVTGTRHKVDGIRFAVPFVSDLDYDTDIFVTPAFEARVNGSAFALSGKARPFSNTRDATLDIDITDLDLPTYIGFSPVAMRAKVAAGKLNAKLHLTFRRAFAATQQAQKSGPAAPPSNQQIALTGSIDLAGLRITDVRGKDVATFPRLSVGIRNIDVLKPGITLDSVVASSPVVRATRLRDGTIDLLQLGAPPKNVEVAAKVGAVTTPLSVGITSLRIADGSLHFTDEALAPAKTTTLQKVAVQIDGYSSPGRAPAMLNVSFATDDGTTLDARGELNLGAHTASGQIAVHQWRPASMGAYTAPLVNLRIEDGSVDASAHYTLDFSGERLGGKLDAVTLAVAKLRTRLPDDTATLLGAESLAIEGGAIDLASRAVTITSMRVVAPAVGIKRNTRGQINLLSMLPAALVPTVTTGVEPAPAPVVLIQSLAIERGSASFDDASTPTPVSLKIDNLALKAQNLTTAKGAQIPFDLITTFNRSGKLALAGNAVLDPVTIDGTITASRLAVAPLAVYAGERLNLTVVSAEVSTRGKFKVALADKSARGNATITTFSGAAEVTNFAAQDKITSADFMRWKTLKLGKVDVQVPAKDAPLALTLNDIAWTDFYARVIVNANGRLNLQDVLAAPGEQQSITTPDAEKGGTTPPPSSAPAPVIEAKSPGTVVAVVPQKPRVEGPRPIIRVGQVALTNGNVNFTDNFIKPNYTANLTQLEGSISAVASDKPEPADVMVRGRIDGDGALDVSGTWNPLAAQLFLDIAASAKDIELTRLTPYAIKYAGYAIDRGKLSMTVKYKIENGQLTAQNRVFLDQLTFGQRVESPSATRLPVLLAVALLKNSRGEIDINLPVSGSLSDPQFSIGGVILRVIVNLLTRAVAAPFSLIASAFGGGAEELGYVEFAPGVSDLSPASKAKVETLTKALADRPALRIDIIGRYDPASDPDGLKRDHLADKVRAQKVKDLSKGGEQVDPETVHVEAAEYPKYLERAYSEEKFDKPRNVIGIAKSMSPEEMERLLLANIKLDENDPRWLAEARADVVRHFIEDTGKVSASRVFLVTPRLNANGIEDKGKPNRVDFALR